MTAQEEAQVASTQEYVEAKSLHEVAAWLQQARSVCVLTGAGVSAESGVPTFRGSDGLWEGHRIEDVATPEAFRRQPKLVWRFYHARRERLREVRPNPGHYALAEMERQLGEGFTLVTQNVDGLHQAAGSRNVLELHGNLRRTRCLSCGEVRDRGLETLEPLPRCPRCRGPLRPDIVWFGEMLPTETWEAAVMAAQSCELFFVIGTSAVVHPAAMLVPIAKRAAAARVVEINIATSEASRYADAILAGPSGVVLPQLIAAWKGEP